MKNIKIKLSNGLIYIHLNTMANIKQLIYKLFYLLSYILIDISADFYINQQYKTKYIKLLLYLPILY